VLAWWVRSFVVVPGGCSGRGAVAVGAAGRGSRVERRPSVCPVLPSCVEGGGGWCGTLLGPEATPAMWWVVLVGLLVFIPLSSFWFCWEGGGGWGVLVGSGGCLRTAQWTRASLASSFGLVR